MAPFFLFAALPAAASAQLPTQAQAQAAVNNPALADKIRAKIAASGLTPDQIRAKLQSAGYSSNLLDSFLGGTANAPSGAAAAAATAGAAGAAGTTAPLATQQMVDVLTTLFPETPQAQGTTVLPVDTGALRTPLGAALPLQALQLFGANVFRGDRTQFQPLLNGPVPPNYRVGPGDQLALIITGDVEFAYSLGVTRDGFVVIPQVGQVFISNLTMDQVERLLRQRLARAYSGITTGTTKFNVTLANLRTNQIFVVGEVVQPGAYQLSSVATVLNALYAAGGPTDRGNFRKVQVRRRGDSLATLDLYDYLLNGNTKNDVLLEQGDVVFVPVHGTRVSLTGAVIRPAIYELVSGQTLKDLVVAGGGFRANAALQRITIARIVPPAQRSPQGPDRIVVDVPISQVQNGQAPPFPVEPGDSVSVFDVPAATRALVELKGHVYHPGTYGWHAGLRISELVKLAGGFQPAVYAGEAQIERLNLADSTRFMVRVSLPADSLAPYPNDLALVDYDVVTVFGREEFRENRFVTIAGMVNRPDKYPYRNGMTVRDLVMMAHGLRDGAYLDTAEVSRLPADRRTGTLAITTRVSLDSTYLFEPDSSTYRRLPGLAGASSGKPEIALEPYDHVLILQQPQYELQRYVDIFGEVTFPGTYSLTRKDERLSDLVQRAGGLLPTAYPDGARFIRTFGAAGRINLNLHRAITEPGSRYDPILQPNDSLAVPEYSPSVRVEGAVNSPTSVLYQEGQGLDYYIGNAGGYARNADEGRVSVHYANGSAQVKSHFLFFGSSPSPGPGSVVVVPSKPDGPPFDSTAFFGSLAQVLASMVAIVVLATKL